MVAGKVKGGANAMSVQKSPANNNNTKSPLLSTPSPGQKNSSSGAGFSRSFGVYFPRASAQVQPRPPDVSELLRLVEELREKESRLKTELLEQKLLKETANIVPILENEIKFKDSEIERSKKKIDCLEEENERMRDENEFLHAELSKQNRKYEDKIKQMQAELSEIKKIFSERQHQEEASSSSSSSSNSSSSNSTPKLIDVTNNLKSGGVKSFRKCSQNSGNFSIESGTNVFKKDEFVNVVVEENNERSIEHFSRSDDSEENGETTGLRSRAPRVPKPPPKPISSSSSLTSVSSPSYGSLADSAERAFAEISFIPPPPPPPPLPAKVSSPPIRTASVPPPPPPPPAKGLKSAAAKVTRVPEVVEFYHSLMRRESNFRRDSASGDTPASGATAKDMIGEIENRSAHLLAIKTDVETQGDFIRFLIKEVEGAAFTDIEDVVPFVKWLDDELSYLVDETAVLKHFDWPEQKADAMREAAFGYRDLKKVETEASSFRDDPRQPCSHALKKMQALFEKLENGVYNLSRMRESSTKRYKLFKIPMNWMLDTGFVSQLKLASVKLAMKYMKRVLAELELVGGGPEEEQLILQGVKFAFRVHQFAGGFDVETMRAFQELRDKARSCNHNQQKFLCRSASAC